MELEEKTNESGQEKVIDGVDYIEAIKEMKQNTVDKATYQKVVDENKKLLKSLVNGETIQSETKPIDKNQLRKDLFSQEADLNNLDYVTKALQLRTACIESGETDPFLPYGQKIAPTTEDVEAANRVADVLKECVEYANGDSLVFTNELQRRMIDTGRPNIRR